MNFENILKVGLGLKLFNGKSTTKTMSDSKNEILRRIAQHLTIQTSYFTELGLYHGKMGMILFLAHYARFTGDDVYDKVAGFLLDDIFEEADEDIPINFEFGLCGIGWGIEYLLENGFMKGNSNDILYEIDLKVMERDLERIVDKSVETGLAGISYYINKRVNSSTNPCKSLPFDSKYLNIWRRINNITIPNDRTILFNICNNIPYGDEISNWKLGLKDGSAGYGIKKILGL